MVLSDDLEDLGREQDGPPDLKETDARNELREFFEARREDVFFSRQVEVQHEDRSFHWISNRAIRHLLEEGVLLGERRTLQSGGSVHLLWHRGFRYYRRAASRLVKTVEEYSDPNIGAALGLTGEAMILEGFALRKFVLEGRNTRSFAGEDWQQTEHNLDFIFEKDGHAYGVEVKNTLGYMEHNELITKIKMCRHLGVAPVFVARMLPKVWIKELNDAGGFALILKHQLYPWAHRDLARRVKAELGLPVDSPRALAEGTMERFVRWHVKRVNSGINSRAPKDK